MLKRNRERETEPKFAMCMNVARHKKCGERNRNRLQPKQQQQHDASLSLLLL